MVCWVRGIEELFCWDIMLLFPTDFRRSRSTEFLLLASKLIDSDQLSGHLLAVFPEGVSEKLET